MPFGKKCGNHSLNKKLYPKLSKEFHRILKEKDGFSIQLTTEKNLMQSSFKKKMVGILMDINKL